MAHTYTCRALRCIPRAADGGAAGACGDRFAGKTDVAKCDVSADRNPSTVHYNSFVIQQDSVPGPSCIQRSPTAAVKNSQPPFSRDVNKATCHKAKAKALYHKAKVKAKA